MVLFIQTHFKSKFMVLAQQGLCEISTLNEKGVGVAETNHGEVYLPLTLPGEMVEFERHLYRGSTSFFLKKIVTPSNNRVIPPCKYFGICGGCMFQHVEESAYEKIKVGFIEQALTSYSIKTQINKIVSISYGMRRRAGFEAVRKNNQVFLGFKRYNSHQIINIDNCLLLLPEINQLILPIRKVLLELLDEKQKAQIYLTVAHNGVDLLIESTSKFRMSKKVSDNLKGLSEPKYGIIRLSLVSEGFKEIVFHSATPYIIFDGIEVEVHATSFLQPSQESEKILQKLVLDFLPAKFDPNYKKEKVVDLFCGRGTYTIPMSNNSVVDGFEFNKESLISLAQSISKTDRSVTLEQRDLSSLPLTKAELDKYAFAVINPPRQGALEQATELSRSKIKKVCYVSCNPATFARDAKIMINGGYELLKVTPIDQFYRSAHIEMVGYFKKK